MTPEGKVKALIKKHLDSLAPQGYYFMPVASRYGRAGIPDFVGCYMGGFFAIEAKTDTGKVTPLQQIELNRISAAEGASIIVHGEQQARELNIPYLLEA